MPSKFEVVRINTDTSSWKPVTCPISCSRIVIENSDETGPNMRFRTDPANGGSEKTIPSGQELDINTYGCEAFPLGDIVGYVQSVTGTGPAVITFTR